MVASEMFYRPPRWDSNNGLSESLTHFKQYFSGFYSPPTTQNDCPFTKACNIGKKIKLPTKKNYCYEKELIMEKEKNDREKEIRFSNRIMHDAIVSEGQRDIKIGRQVKTGSFLLAILNGLSGIAIRFQFRGWRAPGSKPDSPEDLPCLMSPRWCDVEAWRGYQLRCRPCHLTTVQNDNVCPKSSRVSSELDVNVTKLNFRHFNLDEFIIDHRHLVKNT
ncbi:hypothetical protein AVEN_211890-1 [Araneus ventricosus]|uniref:Uncharacterized protein n=1 Tax=Araneus ventricosus TaxID=182803 RepID=A0A4Y2F209_ARAVE|nr:hypothetical protein AVEN_211890-1 [Araneus ventricosus]